MIQSINPIMQELNLVLTRDPGNQGPGKIELDFTHLAIMLIPITKTALP
jgi:hypothetical protein